ncbi:tobamovirus multiplication protein 2A-like [Populus alba x Populus x berolinensis]|nr:tobamovirus multiplication protein 2A-like [Populus alba x Populus x berolinensis]
MARKSPLVSFFFQLINSFFTLSGLAIVSYALHCLLKLKAAAPPPHVQTKHEIARALLGSDQDISKWLSNKLPAAWFIYLLLVIGASLVIISSVGCIGTATRSPCCLCFYSSLLVALFVAQVGVASFMLFDHNWEQAVPNDRSGSFHSTYHFLTINWKIIRWVVIGALVLEAIAIVLALYLRYLSRVSYHLDYHRTVVYPDMTRRNSEKRRNPATAAPSARGTQEMTGARSTSKTGNRKTGGIS